MVDQSESFWLLPGDQLIGIFKCHQFIVRADRWGWNNTVSGDNVPERDDLGSSLGFTDSGAFLPPLRQSGPLLRRPPPSTRGNGNQIYSGASAPRLLPPSTLSSFHPSFHHHHHPPAPSRSPCRRLQVIRGRLSFIILSKSGTALARFDWVSVKHQDLIEFVLKRVLLGNIAYSEAAERGDGEGGFCPSG